MRPAHGPLTSAIPRANYGECFSKARPWDGIQIHKWGFMEAERDHIAIYRKPQHPQIILIGETWWFSVLLVHVVLVYKLISDFQPQEP